MKRREGKKRLDSICYDEGLVTRLDKEIIKVHTAGIWFVAFVISSVTARGTITFVIEYITDRSIAITPLLVYTFVFGAGVTSRGIGGVIRFNATSTVVAQNVINAYGSGLGVVTRSIFIDVVCRVGTASKGVAP